MSKKNKIIIGVLILFLLGVIGIYKFSSGYKISITIDTNIIQGENAIILTYKDNKGNSYEEYVVGYLEKGYSGKANVVINNIDENGKLEITVK